MCWSVAVSTSLLSTWFCSAEWVACWYQRKPHPLHPSQSSDKNQWVHGCNAYRVHVNNSLCDDGRGIIDQGEITCGAKYFMGGREEEASVVGRSRGWLFSTGDWSYWVSPIVKSFSLNACVFLWWLSQTWWRRLQRWRSQPGLGHAQAG